MVFVSSEELGLNNAEGWPVEETWKFVGQLVNMAAVGGPPAHCLYLYRDHLVLGD